MKDFSSVRGSAIIFIFIAIALFAALAYAFMHGTRNSLSMMTDEEAEAYAQQIIAYTNDVEQAVKRMKLRGIPDTSFGFDNTVFRRKDGVSFLNGAGHNPNCSMDNCRVFGSGGQMQANKIPDSALDLNTYSLMPSNTYGAGNWSFHTTAMDGVGTNDEDIMMLSHFIRREICIKINNLLGVNNPSGNPPERGTVSHSLYAGSFPGTWSWESGAAATGKKAYCGQIFDGTTTTYTFYKVVLTR